MFCLTDAGEQQIGWVPDKDRAVLDAVGIMPFAKLPSQIDSATAKTMGDKFTTIIISIMCEIDK